MAKFFILGAFLIPAFGPQITSSDGIDDAVRGIPGFPRAEEPPLAGDGEYLRRVMLDLMGFPPNREETKAFIADPSPLKRAAKIDALLASERFADFWARRFAGVYLADYPGLEIPALSAERRQRLVEGFVGWLRDGIRRDRPYGDTVHEMLEALGDPEKKPAVVYKLSWHRPGAPLPAGATRAIGRHFLGLNLSCIGCHDHPFEKWTVDDYLPMAAFFVRQKASATGEISEGAEDDWTGVPAAGLGKPRPAFIGLGQGPNGGESRAAALGRLATSPQNRQLSSAMVNRVWAWLLGRGIVHPEDDFNLRNRPLSKPLLAVLEKEFEAGSLKRLIRTICLSRTYQRKSGSIPKGGRPTFAQAVVRPLMPEQLLHSIQVATRGKASNDLTEARLMAEFLSGGRESGSEIRPMVLEAASLLFLRHDSRIWDSIRSSEVLRAIRAGDAADRVDGIFLAALSRRPTESERSRFIDFLGRAGETGLEDAYWALLNSTEFVTRN